MEKLSRKEYDRIRYARKVNRPVRERYDNPDGLKADSANSKRWKERHPETYQAYIESQEWKDVQTNSHLKRNYGITLLEKKRMFDEQEGRCAVCNVAFVDLSDAKVDHNHTTKQLRSLLCHHCNAAIGLAREDSETLRRLANYLEYWEQEADGEINVR